LGSLAAIAGCFRPLVRRRLAAPAARRRFWGRVFAGEVASMALAGDEAAAHRALLDTLAEATPPIPGPAKAA
jgi:hypothetical protein